MRSALYPILFRSSLTWARAIGAIAAGDFSTDQSMWNGANVGSHANIPGWSFTRASTRYVPNASGVLLPLASGAFYTPGQKGLYVEGARTNLFLNSAVGATQNVTVAAVAYTLSFRGTGTITLSGVSTAGPLVGTGANDRVTLTFTPTAGTLTLTVSGSCTHVNLEAGAFASSWIETAGASATRAADVALIGSITGIDYPLTLFAEFERVVDTGGNEFLLHLDNASANERAALRVNSSDQLSSITVAGGVQQSGEAVTGALALATAYRGALRVTTNDIKAARGGTLSSGDASATNPTAPSALRFCTDNASANHSFGLLKRWALIPSAASDAALQAMTT